MDNCLNTRSTTIRPFFKNLAEKNEQKSYFYKIFLHLTLLPSIWFLVLELYQQYELLEKQLNKETMIFYVYGRVTAIVC